MPSRSAALAPISSMQSYGITRESFEQVETLIRQYEAGSARAMIGIDLLVRMMIMSVKSIAQEKSAGPVAPGRRSNPALAYRIPVQRITGRYFAGWTQRRLRPGTWILYNDAKEAVLIETGMYQRVRRPILKMSVIGMLRFIQTTRSAERWVGWVIGPQRNATGQFQSFQSRMMNTSTLGGMAGPTGNLP